MSIEWNESYNVYRARLGLIDLIVHWDSSRDLSPAEKEQFKYGYYTVSVEGAGSINSKKKFADRDEAKGYAVSLAKTWIAKMAAQLADDPAPESGQP